MTTLGRIIHERRKARKLTQVALARKVGIAQANLSNIEKDKQDLTVLTLRRIAHALECDVRSFFPPEQNTQSPKTSFTRRALEHLAAVICGQAKVQNEEERRLAALFSMILPSRSHQKRSKTKVDNAWLRLNQFLTNAQIEAVCARVRDARQRVV